MLSQFSASGEENWAGSISPRVVRTGSREHGTNRRAQARFVRQCRNEGWRLGKGTRQFWRAFCAASDSQTPQHPPRPSSPSPLAPQLRPRPPWRQRHPQVVWSTWVPPPLRLWAKRLSLKRQWESHTFLIYSRGIAANKSWYSSSISNESGYSSEIGKSYCGPPLKGIQLLGNLPMGIK